MAIAFRFFEPITAPIPERPTCLLRSFVTLASTVISSPAGPMEDTRTSSSWSSSRIISSVSQVVFPAR